jgi:chromosomal replication initiation ATPase DnaA
MKAKKLFLKDVRDYLSEATEYDIKRIGEIFDRYCVTVVKNEITILKDNRPYAEADAIPLPRVAAPTLIDENVIVDICCNQFKVTKEKVMSPLRKKEVTLARRCVAFLLFNYKKWTVTRIGDFLGIDHTSVTIGVRDIKRSFMDKTPYAFMDLCLILDKLVKAYSTEKELVYDSQNSN